MLALGRELMVRSTAMLNRAWYEPIVSLIKAVMCMMAILSLAGCGGGAPQVTARAEPVALNDDIEKVVRLADTLRNQGELTTAIAMYQQAASRTDDVNILVKLGQALAAQGATERSAGIFRRAVSKSPEHPEALLGLGIAYLELGEFETSIQFLDQLVKQGNSGNLLRFSALGAAHDLAGNHDKALAAYREGLKIEPRNLDLKSNLALSHALSNRHDEAIRLMREVTNSLDAQRSHHRNMVLILALAGQNREAVSVGVRRLGKTETQEVLTQASAARSLTTPADRARALGAS